MSTLKSKKIALSVINVSTSNIMQKNVSIKRERRYFMKKFSIFQKINRLDRFHSSQQQEKFIVEQIE